LVHILDAAVTNPPPLNTLPPLRLTIRQAREASCRRSSSSGRACGLVWGVSSRYPWSLVDRTVVNDNQHLYRASKYDRDVCRLKPPCCPKEPARKVPRSIHEGARDMTRAIAPTDAYLTARGDKGRKSRCCSPT
jgi:hypothetical protein